MSIFVRIRDNIKKEGLRKYLPSRLIIVKKWIVFHYGGYFKYYLAKIGMKGKCRRIEQFKGVHKGERCFVICTGPSLTIEDLEKIKNEITISMNSIIFSLGDISYAPDYYFFSDCLAYPYYRDAIISNRSVFKSMFAGTVSWKRKWLNDADWVCYNMIGESGLWLHHRDELSFSGDPSLGVFECGTIAYSILQVVFYMGFSEVYMIGADCGYSKEKDHFNEERINIERSKKNHKDPTNEIGLNKMYELGYIKAKEYAEKHGIKLYNATRGGYLEVLERVDLDEVLDTKHMQSV